MDRSRTAAEYRVQKFCTGESRTHQSFKDQCDINRIVRLHAGGGQLTHLNKTQPRYGDFSDLPSYQEAFDKLHEAEAQFMELPARVRSACNNDPAQFIEMVYDPDRMEELEQLGLVKSRVPEALVESAQGEEKAAGGTQTPSGSTGEITP